MLNKIEQTIESHITAQGYEVKPNVFRFANIDVNSIVVNDGVATIYFEKDLIVSTSDYPMLTPNILTLEYSDPELFNKLDEALKNECIKQSKPQ